MALAPFATTDELEKFWRTLVAGETERANTLLVMASNRLRLMAENVGIDLDARITESDPFKSTLQWVVMEAVKRALATPTDSLPVNSMQKTAGPYSENYTFTNPSGDLWFKKTELDSLGLYGSQKLDSISTTRCDIYGEGS